MLSIIIHLRDNVYLTDSRYHRTNPLFASYSYLVALTNAMARYSHSPKTRILQNYRLAWLDPHIDESSSDHQHSLQQLRTVINNVNIFSQLDACVEFLRGVTNEKIFVITSDSLGRDLVPQIHSMELVHTIYISRPDRTRKSPWIEEWSKVKDVNASIESICNALRQSARNCNHDLTPLSFALLDAASPSTDLNQLEPSFMYTQLFKNALLDIQHDEHAVKDLARYCREKKADAVEELKLINEFEGEYRPDRAIWWYTRETFIYQMLNRALRLLEADIIVRMGFFVHDLHRQIEQLHKDQLSQYHGQHFTVHRGQGLSMADFDKLTKTQGRLIAFNSFLSTSRDPGHSRFRADSASQSIDNVGIVFFITVNPAVTSTPFADISHISCFEGEAEVLFSMHSVFRIDQVVPLNAQGKLFEVRLTLTADDDPQLRQLTDCLHEEIQDVSGCERIGKLLVTVGQLDTAEEFYLALLERTSDRVEKAEYYHQLGSIKFHQHKCTESLSFYQKALDERNGMSPSSETGLAKSYHGMGLAYEKMKDYPKALSFCEKALAIRKRTLPSDHPALATSYNHIGAVHKHMGKYADALLYCEMALAMRKKILPPNHHDLANSYQRMSSVYLAMENHSMARDFGEKALAIRQRTLPDPHPVLAISRGNLSEVYESM